MSEREGDTQRVNEAVAFIFEHQVEGAHHKQWVLDQVVRILTGGKVHMDDPGVIP